MAVPPPSLTVRVTACPTPPPAPRALIVVVKSSTPVVGTAVANAGLLELITLLVFPPEMLITPLPVSGMQIELGAAVNGRTGATVPGEVVMFTVATRPAASVISTVPGPRQKFGLNIEIEKASPLLWIVGGKMPIAPGNVVLAV